MSHVDERLLHGWNLHQRGELSRAETIYREVLAAAPQHANAWCYLGMACHDQGRYEDAVRAYRKALAIQPVFPVVWNNLGNSFRHLRRLEDAIRAFETAIQQKPGYVNAIRNQGTTLLWEGFLDRAADCYRQAQLLAPDDAETHKNLGVIALMKGDFQSGWDEYEWRCRLPEVSLVAPHQPQWKGESLDDKVLLLIGEQGLGDTIHFSRYAEVLQRQYRCQIWLACQESLHPLLSSCVGIDRLLAADERPLGVDYWSPLLSVPGRLGHCDISRFPHTVPYLSAESSRVAKWREVLSHLPGIKVGLCWQGNSRHQADRMRSIALRELLPLARIQGVTWICLQRGEGVEQIDSLHCRFPIQVLAGLDDQGGAFVDTAALMQSLDLVITIDSAIAHVAGAFAIPTWLLLAHVPDWRWLLDTSDSCWYPTLRLFRQPRVDDWQSVVRDASHAIVKNYPSTRWKQPQEYLMSSNGSNRLSWGRHGMWISNRHDIYIGRSMELYGEFSQSEIDVFRQFLRPGACVVEVGANIGTHTIPLAQLVGPQGNVEAFEPQRQIYYLLCGNVALNGLTNVNCRMAAVGREHGDIMVPTIRYDEANNFGGLALGACSTGERLPLVTLDEFHWEQCDLLKVDVEGMELDVLYGGQQTLQRCHPILYVENDREQLSAPLIEFLLERGYRLFWHTPALYNPANYFQNPHNEFPGLVSVNMLGIPNRIRAQIEGLRPILSPKDQWNQ